MKLSDYIAQFLAQYTRHVFVGTGGCIVHTLDSIARRHDIKVIPSQNEQAGAMAADAYYRVSKSLGVGIATSGPGIINLLQGIGCAYFDSIPNLYITGAPPVKHLKGKQKVRQLGFQEMDVVGTVRSLTKYAVLLTEAKKIRYELEKCVYLAFEGRPGPVLMDLPDDLQRADIQPQQLESFKPPKKEYKTDANKISRLMEWIHQSQRPVVIVGAGVKLAHAEDECYKFLNKSRLPYAPTWAAIDMFIDHEPRLVGSFGVSANRAGNFAVQTADLIISLGSRLDTHETGSDPSQFAPLARKVMIDIDPSELNKKNNFKLDLKINSDLKIFLKTIIKEKFFKKDLSAWIQRIQDWRKKYPACLKEYYDQKEFVNPYVFINELSKVTGENAVIIPDTGANLTWVMQSYKIRRPQMLFSAFNHSPMGYSLPAAIGAQFADPKRQVVCIIGDGGLQMNIQELETVSHYKLPVKIIVMDNYGYGIIRQTQDTWLDSRYVATDPSTGLGVPSFAKVARAYGIEAIELSRHKDIPKVLSKILNSREPILCAVKIKKEQKIIPKLEYGRPIEDMSPLLPREEFKEEMAV